MICLVCGFESGKGVHLCLSPRSGQEIGLTKEQHTTHKCDRPECETCHPELREEKIAKIQKLAEQIKVKELDIRQQAHYTQFKIQPVVFIAENGLDFLTGNIIKYVLRHKAKNGLQDLEKAKHYLDMLIQKTKGEKVTP